MLATYQSRAKFDGSHSGMRVARNWVASAYEKQERDAATTGFTRMRDLVPAAAKAIGEALEWLGCANYSMVWEVPLRIDALKPVVPFDPNILPPLLSEYCVGIARASCVPLEVPVVSAIVAASVCIGNRAAIQPKALDASWQQIPNLWGLVIAEPGSNKSGAMSAALKPLKKIDGEMQQQSASAKAEYNERAAHYKRALSLHESRMKKIMASDDPDQQPPETPTQPQRPPYKQIIVNETTPEALHSKCIDNPCGLLNFSDELSAWFNSMEKKGHETERALWLKGWTGDQSHSIATLSRGDVFVPKLCLSVLGGMQPGRWREYMRDWAGGGDGLVQRLQLAVWPDESEQEYTDIPADEAVAARIEKRFRELITIGGEGEELPVVYKFTPEAQEVFINWWNRMAAKRAASNKIEAIESHYAKFKSLLPSLALIFQLFDDADRRLFEDEVHGSRKPAPCVVDAINTQRAVRFCKWLVPHAERSYGCMQNSVGVETLTTKIRTGKLEIKPGEWVDSFSYTDILRKEWKGLHNKEDLMTALGVLRDRLWVHYNSAKRKYFINPKLKSMV
jgi:putative DNA primase/helicase